MNVNDLFPSKYLKAHDLGGKVFTLTIRDVTLEDVGHGAEQERKLTLAFEKATKMMLLNRTNAMIIASLYGPETDAWLGKAVTVYSARIKAFGAWHDALRIREQIPARNVGAAKMTEAMQEDPPLDDENDLLDVEEGEQPRPPDPDEDFGMGAAHNAPATAQDAPADRLTALRQQRLNVEMSDLEHNHEKRELARIDAEIAKLEQSPSAIYAHLIDKLTGDCLERANRARKIHAQSRGGASPEQYRFLAGTIDDLVRQMGGHKAILEVFVGRVVSSANPPGAQLAGKLLDALLETRTVEVDGEKVKEKNPDYNPEAVSCVHAIYSLCREQDGQASLFDAQPEQVGVAA